MEISQENLHLHLQTAIRDLLEKTIKNHQEVTRGHISSLLKIKGFIRYLIMSCAIIENRDQLTRWLKRNNK